MDWDSVLSSEAKGCVLAQLERLAAIAWSVQNGCPAPPTERPDLFTSIDLPDTVRLLVSLWLPDIRSITADEERDLRDQSVIIVPHDYFTDDAVVVYWAWAADDTRSGAIRALWNERMTAVGDWCRLIRPYLVFDLRSILPGEDHLLDLTHHLHAFRTGLEALGYPVQLAREREASHGSDHHPGDALCPRRHL